MKYLLLSFFLCIVSRSFSQEELASSEKTTSRIKVTKIVPKTELKTNSAVKKKGITRTSKLIVNPAIANGINKQNKYDKQVQNKSNVRKIVRKVIYKFPSKKNSATK